VNYVIRCCMSRCCISNCQPTLLYDYMEQPSRCGRHSYCWWWR